MEPWPNNEKNLDLLGLWSGLLVQLLYTARECTQPDAIRRLRAFGVRNPNTVARNLLGEYAKAHDFAVASGFKLPQSEIERLMHEQGLRDDLSEDFRALAQQYQQLSAAMWPRCGSPQFRWVSRKAQVHFARANALGQES
ncbi:hypothetical protein [Trinickia dinghuensis]|uniref:Uncharacterized protein n=1 Tax=Trinickia dinghuensis TaxID=2291023 RepID=A0A3D8K356_9BURK|nr:hypothetical protein [Trinickia dinghuensis]RDU99472.1 hypothetical protein DWV00_07350 [Trinickia dinghuensis]